MKNGKIKVVLGKIIVINPVDEGKYPTITPSSKGMLTINGKEEIEQLLKEANVIYGIKEEAIEEITKAQNGGRVLVAEGLKPIDAIDEKIEFVFNKEDVSIGEYEKIDYKNINKINGVEATAIIGKVIKGEDSKFGINVFGQEVKPKKNKRKIIRCGNGCNILDDNIIAEISGQVSYKNETVSVNKVYKIDSNVDISTRNINFEGDIQIHGNVNEGMCVYGKNNVNISGGVFGI